MAWSTELGQRGSLVPMREGFSEWQRGAEGNTLTRVVRAGRARMGECCKSWGLRRMPDVPLKITKYVIFVLTQIASSAGFLSGQVVSSTKSLKTRVGGWTEARMENIPDTEVPGPCDLGQGYHCEVLREASPPTASEGCPLRGKRQDKGG